MSLQSVFAMGCIIGLLIMPAISDTRGKFKAMNLCLLFMLFGDLFVFLGIFSKMYYIIALGQMMAAFGSISVAAISYSLNSDFFSDDLRQKAVIYYCAAW
jgi:MFS family permease